MASTGSLLRELREQRGISLEELARSTRINPRVLAALEIDDLGALPPGPFAKGFIRADCQALGAEPDAILAQCSMTAGDPVGPRELPPAPRQVPPRSRAPVLVSFALLVGLGLALAAVTLALKPSRDESLLRLAPSRNHADSTAAYTGEAPVPGPPSDGRAPAAGNTDPAVPPGPAADPKTSASGPQTPRAAALPARPSTASKAKSYRLVARASQTTRIRVRLDGRRTVEEIMPAGAVREWISSRPVELRIVNAGGVTLELNGRVLPSLGARGTTVHHLVLPMEPR